MGLRGMTLLPGAQQRDPLNLKQLLLPLLALGYICQQANSQRKKSHKGQAIDSNHFGEIGLLLHNEGQDKNMFDGQVNHRGINRYSLSFNYEGRK